MPAPEALQAPARWRAVEFISDLHLHGSDIATFDAWQAYMQACQADALFILGDLFEVWVGDDCLLDSSSQAGKFETLCAQVLGDTTKRLPVYFMHGNRDFLVGKGLMLASGMTQLADPTVLQFGSQNWLLTHGDALCLADLDYQKFRKIVRTPQWQSEFLAKPLSERRAEASAMRDASEARKKSGPSPGVAYADADTPAVMQWLHHANAGTMIHGHTHQPANHPLAQGGQRIVLSDWDCTATPPRTQVLRLTRLARRDRTVRQPVSVLRLQPMQ